MKIKISEDTKRELICAIYMEKGREYIDYVIADCENKRKGIVAAVPKRERAKYEREVLNDEIRCKSTTSRGNRCTFYAVENGHCQRHIGIVNRVCKEVV